MEKAARAAFSISGAMLKSAGGLRATVFLNDAQLVGFAYCDFGKKFPVGSPERQQLNAVEIEEAVSQLADHCCR